MFFGSLQFKGSGEGLQQAQQPTEEKKSEEVKSSSSEQFLKTPEAKEFIKDWSSKMKDGKPIYTKRGVSELLRNMSQVPGLKSDKAVLVTSKEILRMLGGMDGLQGFLAGWKAKSEGIVKGIKSLFGK